MLLSRNPSISPAHQVHIFTTGLHEHLFQDVEFQNLADLATSMSLACVCEKHILMERTHLNRYSDELSRGFNASSPNPVVRPVRASKATTRPQSIACRNKKRLVVESSVYVTIMTKLTVAATGASASSGLRSRTPPRRMI